MSLYSAILINPKDGGIQSFLGAPRIHGELLKLGIEVSECPVSRLLPRQRKPSSQTWKAFLNNHVQDLVSIDFITVPTATLRVLFVLVVLAHHCRRVVHFNATEPPTALRTGQQVVEAFPDDTAPRYLLRDRDQIYGDEFRTQVRGLGITEVKIAPQSPWQYPFAARLVGSIRRECLDHVIVLGEKHQRMDLTSDFAYCGQSRTYLSLDKDAPEPRPSNHQKGETSLRFPMLVASIIGTNGERRSQQKSILLIARHAVQTE